MDDGDVWVTGKVLCVESRQMSYSMYLHCCHQSSVMNSNPEDGMQHNDPPPFVIDGFAIREQHHPAFYRPGFPVGMGRR